MNQRQESGAQRQPTRLRRLHRRRGFTLIELVVVMSLILVLISIAVPVYNQSVLRAKESVLRQDLFTMRSVISQYTLDKQKAPVALEDIVTAGYLKKIPVDPMTGRNDSWQVEQEDVLLAVDQQEPGITDIHSGANLTSSEGTTYSSW